MRKVRWALQLALISAVGLWSIADAPPAIAGVAAAIGKRMNSAESNSVERRPGPHRKYDAVVRTLESVVEKGYHDAQAGKAIAEAIARRRESGRYSLITAPKALAEVLTADLVQISKDAHFAVAYDSSAAATMIPGRGGRPPKEDFEEMPRDEADFWRSVAFGIEAVEWLEGNIGRLDIRAFARPYREVREQYASAMKLMAHTDALVIDLTDNGGGSVHMVGHVLSYFFERPPFLTKTISWRTEAEETFTTAAALDGPSYGEKRPVIVAVSSSTFSGGEELAYSLQAFGRATVVGERTRGGANPVATWELGDGFKVIVPTGRVRHPSTGGNWEGVGVTPDVAVKSPHIVSCSHRIGVALAEARQRSAPDPTPAELQQLCDREGKPATAAGRSSSMEQSQH
jgi:hypothetical protein